ncbi:MAG: family 10 glycosylhydrolase [Cyanobacteria bacterium P01_F01_bin.150]
MKQTFKKWIKRLALAVLSFWFVIFFWQAPVVYPQQTLERNPQEIRGVWMTDAASALMYTSTRADEVVANLANHHLNTLYPAVWDRGYTLYPNSVTKKAGGKRRDPLFAIPLLPFQDALKGLTHQAHRQHLRLIPWFEYGLIIPASSPIAQAHPDWLTTNQAGELVAKPLTADARLPKPLQNLQLELAGGNWAWLNPCHPEVQQFLTDLIVDVVKRYPVDGIQLDDHFGLPVEFGYDAYTAALYQQDHGGASPPTDPRNGGWMRWRAAHITQLFEKISTAVKAEDAEAIVSLSPNPPAFSYREYLQDWPTWVEKGWVDEVIVQVYRDAIDAFNGSLYNDGYAYLNQRVPVGIGIYTGPFLGARSLDHITQQVEAVKAAGYRGVAFFCWETTLWFFKGSPVDAIRQSFQELFLLQ